MACVYEVGSDGIAIKRLGVLMYRSELGPMVNEVFAGSQQLVLCDR